MQILSKPLSGAPISDSFRTVVSSADSAAVRQFVLRTGVFSAAEVEIACELVEEHLAKGAEASGYYFVFADAPTGLQGYACFGPMPGTVARYELYWIAVDPENHARGLGHRLQAAAEVAARAMSGVMMVAETSTRADYAPARAFYVREGYRLLAEIPDWHDEGDGLAIYGKRL